MARPPGGDKTDLLEGLKGLSQDAILLQLKTLHSLRSSFAKTVAGNDFLLALTRLQLSYYGELLQLVTDHFDEVAERLRDLMAPPKAEIERLDELELRADLGDEVPPKTVSIRNTGPAAVEASFKAWQWRCADGGRENRMEMTVESCTARIPKRGQASFTLRFGRLDQPTFARGLYRGEVTVLFNGEAVSILPVKLVVS